jgi:hypothetical protein
MNCDHVVVLVQYESGADSHEVIVGSGTAGAADGQLAFPLGVKFSADGQHVFVADNANHRVSKFSAVSGQFVTHVGRQGTVSHPTEVCVCEDGGLLVAQGVGVVGAGLVPVGMDGRVGHKIVFRGAFGEVLRPYSLSSCALFDVIVKSFDGSAFLLRDAWVRSTRHAWICALCLQ